MLIIPFLVRIILLLSDLYSAVSSRPTVSSEMIKNRVDLKRLLSVSTASMMYQYFVKIVPTIYVKTDGEVSPLSVQT